MELVENDIMDRDDFVDSDDYIFNNLKKRCKELIKKYPNKQRIFLDYIRKQEIENDILENKVVGTTLVIKENRVK